MSKVEISKRRYEELLDNSAHMNALEILGVDNWGGYVGRCNSCDKCELDFSWAEEKCKKCGEFLTTPMDMIYMKILNFFKKKKEDSPTDVRSHMQHHIKSIEE